MSEAEALIEKVRAMVLSARTMHARLSLRDDIKKLLEGDHE